MKKLLGLLTSRVFIVSALIFLQIALIALFMLFLSWMFIPVLLGFLLLNFILVIGIINRNSTQMFKVAWIIPVLIFPVCGALFYIMFGRMHLNKKNTAKLSEAFNSASAYFNVNTELLKKVSEENPHISREAKYITSSAKSDIFEYTKTEYLSPGAVFYEKLLSELEKAENFIFLEYFIIAEGVMWSKIERILAEKVENGVEVWIMYDDIGSINTVGLDFPVKLKKLGFKAAVFNPYKPSIDKFLNYRDHRKFAIIDGKTAFTGGINIADEYIGEKKRFGIWEDSAVMVKGDAVNRITIMFLQMWYFATGELPDYSRYRTDYKESRDGYVIPFADHPLDSDLICENAYINVINNAKNYVYICTPYLILDDVMTAALTRAASSGIDVKIILPGMPDKKLIFYMTQSNYSLLIDGGVKIYEYTPGFLHCKMIISDDKTCIVGTANFDYRSFYLHFENGIWFYESKAVLQSKKSFVELLKASERVTHKYIASMPFYKKLISSLLKVFAPLL